MAAKQDKAGKEKSKTSSKGKKQDTFIEQAIANIEERAKKEIDDLRERIEDGIEDMSTRANQRTSKLEEAFDKRVAQAYNRLGLPSKADIDLLEAKIDKLQKTVAALKQDNAEKPSKTTRKKTAKKKSTATTKKKP
ncbi:MAG: phasin family protein [Pseudomonadales bacterium]